MKIYYLKLGCNHFHIPICVSTISAKSGTDIEIPLSQLENVQMLCSLESKVIQECGFQICN